MEITNHGKTSVNIGDGTFRIILRPDETICFHPIRAVSIEATGVEMEKVNNGNEEFSTRN